MVFSERIHGFGFRNAFALVALLAAAALVFTHSAGADNPAFAPTISLQTSTTRAAAHPDARITVDMGSSTEALKDATIDLPYGMMGSLNAADQCSVTDAQNVDCPAASKIGTVTNYAKVDDSDAVLSGSVYLTKALPPYDDTDPAGLQIVVPAKIGGVDMGTVHVNARVEINHAPISPDWGGNTPTDAVGVVRGVRTVVTDVPRDVTDDHGRSVSFSLSKLVVDLKSDQESPYSKLLTNSSRCRTTPITLDATSYDSTDATASDDYTVSQCDDVHVSDPKSFSFAASDTNVSDPFTISSGIELEDDQPALSSVSIQMPASVTFDGTGMGTPTQQCLGTSINYGENGDEDNFAPGNCPSTAKVGKVEIETPLLPDPVVGDLYLVESAAGASIGIWVDPTTGPNNPAGVSFGVGGTTSIQKPINSCPTSGTGTAVTCRTAFQVDFIGLPDIPVKKMTVIGDATPRPDPNNGPDLSGKFLVNASAGDANCQPVGDTTLRITSWVGWSDDDQKSYTGSSAVSPYPISGCDDRSATLTAAPFGTYTTDNPPSLTFDNATSTTGGKCGVDTMNTASLSNCNPASVGGSYTYTPGSALAQGVHYFFARVVNNTGNVGNWRAFSIPVDPPTDTTAPAVSLSNEPGATTSDTTPSVDYSSDEDAYFQCALDDGPFLPCDSSVTDPGTGGSYTVPSALIPSDATYTIAVRAQDAAGNISDTETTSFKVEVPLDPTFEVLKPDTNTPGLSTEVARAHPEMDIKVTSGSHEDIQNLSLEMPDGLLGSLNAAPTICPIATAQAGNCTDASQVGTVDTEAVVDQSTVRLSGKVYMTSAIVPGDPAGLVIDVPAKIQTIDDGHVIVPVRLSVRGPQIGSSNSVSDIKGIDSIATDLPTGLDPSAWGNTWDGPSEFDLRSMTLKLRNNPDASQSLLTNPSDCTPDNFAVSFKGYDGTTVNKTTPDIDWTGCDSLGFGPSISMSLIDPATGTYPAETTNAHRVSANLTTDLIADPSGASIRNASVLLPKNVTVDVAYLPVPCPVDTYEGGGADACPASTIVGSVSATSPMLREPLSGKVYLLKSESSLPKLVLALRGAINTDIIGDMRTEVSQVRTTFSSVPDAPISSMHLEVNRVILTRDYACSIPADQTNAITTFNAYNGKAATTASALPNTCTGSAEGVSFRYHRNGKHRKTRSTLTMTLRAPTGTKYKSLRVRFPRRGIWMVKKGFRNGLSIKRGSKRLKYTCGRTTGTTHFVTTLCKEPSQFVTIEFGRGTLRVKNRVIKPRFRIIAIDDRGRKQAFTVQSAH